MLYVIAIILIVVLCFMVGILVWFLVQNIDDE